MPAVYTIAYVVYNQLHKQMGMYNHYKERNEQMSGAFM